MKKLDEQELAGYCSQGDTKAQDELYRRYAARLETLCRRYLGDQDEARDLMLETLVQALEGELRCRPPVLLCDQRKQHQRRPVHRPGH